MLMAGLFQSSMESGEAVVGEGRVSLRSLALAGMGVDGSQAVACGGWGLFVKVAQDLLLRVDGA